MKNHMLAAILASLVGGSALAQDIETPEMRAHNQQFREQQLARPDDPYGYRETEKYGNASPEERKKIDEGQRKAQESNKAITKLVPQAKLFQDCQAAHADDPYNAANCNMKGVYHYHKY